MGFFSFLNSNQTYTDKVWRTRTFAFRGMIAEAMLTITQNEIPVVFTFFEQTRQEVLTFLNTNQVPHVALTADSFLTAAQEDKGVFVADAQLIHSKKFLDWVYHGLPRVNFFFAGHYPLPQRESIIIQKLQTAFPKRPLVFHSSMEDPSFTIFGTNKLGELLDKLGMKEEEPIEHTFVTRSMQRAREKVQRMVRSEIVAHSEEEWFTRNVKR